MGKLLVNARASPYRCHSCSAYGIAFICRNQCLNIAVHFENAALRRSGGIDPMRWDEVVGRVAPRDFTADEAVEL